MKKTGLISGLFVLLCLFVTSLRAQSYDQMWKEMENLEKKDLPKSVISQMNRIYAKAENEKNAPQMMKAFLVRTEAKVSLSADSLNENRDTCCRVSRFFLCPAETGLWVWRLVRTRGATG